jgi:hypothetical protein
MDTLADGGYHNYYAYSEIELQQPAKEKYCRGFNPMFI